MTFDTNRPRLLALGGAHPDRRGQSLAPFVPGASNPGRMREDIGGGAFNALRAAVQRGVGAGLLSVRGGDAAGERVAAALDAAGIDDLSAIFIDRATPSYTAILDHAGEVVAGLADMELYDIGFPRQVIRRKLRDAVAGADAVLCDANLPASALARLAGLCGDRPLYALAISPAKVVRFESVLASLSVLFMNRREALALAGLGGEASSTEIVAGLRDRGLRHAVVSDGQRPVIAVTPDAAFAIAPPDPGFVVDATGAGDALAGVATAALMKGEPFAEALREGMAAACLTLQSAEAVSSLDAAVLEAWLARVPHPVVLA